MNEQNKNRNTIHLIDSELDILQTLEETAQKYDYVITTPADFSRIIEEVAEMNPSMIFLVEEDENLNPPELLVSLKEDERTKSIPVAVLYENKGGLPVHYELLKRGDYLVEKSRLEEFLPSIMRTLNLLRKGVDAFLSKETLTFLVELSEALNSSLKFEDKLFVIVKRLAIFMSLDRSSIVLKGVKRTTGYVISSHDDPDIRRLKIDLKKYPEILRAMEILKPVVISDILADPILTDFSELLSRIELKTIMAVPLLVRERSVGSLLLNRKRGDHFTAIEASLASVVANLTSTLIMNSDIISSIHTYDLMEDGKESGEDGIVNISSEIEDIFEEIKEE